METRLDLSPNGPLVMTRLLGERQQGRQVDEGLLKHVELVHWNHIYRHRRLLLAAEQTRREGGHARRFFDGPLVLMRQHRLSTFRTSSLRHDFDRTVIITVIAVWMMQVTLYEIIDVVAVGHRLVPAIAAVFVRALMTAAIVVGCAALRVLRTDFQDMLLDQRGATGLNRIM
jgi:hypothetical protein